jgi:hypothetical protein
VLAVRWREHLWSHGARCQSLDLFGHSGLDSLEHSAATRQDDIAEEVLADVLVALHDRVVSVLVDAILAEGAARFRIVVEGRREQKLWTFKSFLAYENLLAAWQEVEALSVARSLIGLLHFGVVVEGDHAVLNFDLFTFNEAIGILSYKSRVLGSQHLVHKLCQILSADRDLCSREGNSVALIDWHCVRDTFTTVENGTSCLAVREKGQDSLVSNVELRHFELSKPETEKVVN